MSLAREVMDTFLCWIPDYPHLPEFQKPENEALPIEESGPVTAAEDYVQRIDIDFKIARCGDAPFVFVKRKEDNEDRWIVRVAVCPPGYSGRLFMSDQPETGA